MIAARAGKVQQEILIVPPLDTWTPLSHREADNASGLAFMLELAQHLSQILLHYGIRLVALSADEVGLHGMDGYLAGMSAQGVHRRRKIRCW